jgi:hypothetical protein
MGHRELSQLNATLSMCLGDLYVSLCQPSMIHVEVCDLLGDLGDHPSIDVCAMIDTALASTQISPEHTQKAHRQSVGKMYPVFPRVAYSK